MWFKREGTYVLDQISRSVVSDSLRPHESQHDRPPCPSPTPRVHSDSRPLSQWCLWLIHVDVWQKPIQYCEAICFQLKINKFGKNRIKNLFMTKKLMCNAIFKMDNQWGPMVIAQGTLLNAMWQPGWEGSLKENGLMYIYSWVSLLYTWNYYCY